MSEPTRSSSKLALILCLGAVAGAGIYACGQKVETRGAAEAAVPSRSCAERAESGVVRPNPVTDSVAGGVAFKYARGTYRSDLRELKRTGKAQRDRWYRLKTLVVAEDGPDVIVSVPAAMRPWLALGYTGRQAGAVRLSPCERQEDRAAQAKECEFKPYRACQSGLTQFNGFVAINFARAPRYGRCAKLWIEPRGERRVPLHLYSSGKACQRKRPA